MTLMDDVTNDDDDQVIAAEGEKTASVALRAASDNIAGNHAAMQLRWKLFANCFSPLKKFKIFYPTMDRNIFKFFLIVRYLQTLSSISCEKNSTIIFPVPIDMLSGMYRKQE